MKYLVDNRYYHDGTVSVKIVEVPDNVHFEYFIAGKYCDIWFDVFDTYKSAKQYADKCTQSILDHYA